MKLAKILMLTALSLSVITGCSQNNSKEISSASSSNQNDSITGSSPSSSPAKLDLSIYDTNNKEGKFEENDQQVSWTFEGIELTAEKMKSDKAGPDSDYLGKIILNNDGKSYALQSQNKILQIQSVSLSKDHKRVAISLSNGAGSELNIVNLENGDVNNLNEIIIHDSAVETIHAYNWSPSDHRLAFAFGDTSSSSIGIFDADTNNISKIPTQTTYISTAYVLWNKNGKSLDISGEYPSDQYKLYRFDGENKVEEIVDITREDLAKLSEYGPSMISQ